MLKRHAQDPVAEVSEIDELAEFFGDEEEENEKGVKDGDENPRGSLKIRARPLPKKKLTASSDDPGSAEDGEGDDDQDGGEQDGDGDGEGGNEGGGGDNDKDGGDGSSGSGGKGKKAITSALALRNVRAIVLAPSKRRIAFTSQTTGEIRVELEDSGADTNRVLKVTNATVGQVVDGRLRVTCVANSRVVVDVDLEREFDGTVRVKANAI